MMSQETSDQSPSDSGKPEQKQIESVRTLSSPAGKVLARQYQLRPGSLAAPPLYSTPERRRIVQQLRLALAEFYVHLERKKAIYGFDPVRALDLLLGCIETLSDGEFHESIVQIIARCKDRHVAFVGRTPFGTAAVLPFTIEKCWDGDAPQYIVTKIDERQKPASLRIGAIVTHWNGVPIERLVRLNANLFDGGNEASALARSLFFLTQRPLGRVGPPLEEWVDLRFMINGASHEERFVWEGFDAAQTPLTPALGRNLTGFGGDFDLLQLQQVRRTKFAPGSYDAETATAPPSGLGIPQIIGSTDNFSYGSVTSAQGSFGYVRLRTFEVNDIDQIVNALIPVLAQLPQNGLIIDMRDNSGGYIAAGERVLQLLTPRRITPSKFQFRVTASTRPMIAATKTFETWAQSFSEAFATGEPYSQGYAIEGTEEDVNKVGQKYFGPVVLITNALAFSTADIFVAGFIDHGIGRVICADTNMAAAGGNNWVWPVVRLFSPDFSAGIELRSDIDKGMIPTGLRDSFNREGASLSAAATISPSASEYNGLVWKITDGALTHALRYVQSMGERLYVYVDRGHLGLAELPAGVRLGITMRRCVRVGKSEGRLLEDLGIEPDVYYRMTFKDITEQNQDMIARACLELSAMAPKVS